MLVRRGQTTCVNISRRNILQAIVLAHNATHRFISDIYIQEYQIFLYHKTFSVAQKVVYSQQIFDNILLNAFYLKLFIISHFPKISIGAEFNIILYM